MNPITAIAVAAVIVAPAPALAAPERVDLDVPGNLATIQRERPDHFAKIQRILAEAPRRPLDGASVGTWMRTEFQATDIRYTDLIMASDPPKKRLQFSLDDTSYVTVIRLEGAATLMPLK